MASDNQQILANQAQLLANQLLINQKLDIILATLDPSPQIRAVSEIPIIAELSIIPELTRTPELRVESKIAIEDFTNILAFGVLPIDSQVEGLAYRGNYYEGFTNPSEDGYWIGFENNPIIVKVKSGVLTKENAISWIGKPEFLSLDLSTINLMIPFGTYILLGGAGVDPFWYQKTKLLFGSGTLIGIKNDQSQIFNRITPNVSGVTLQNIITDSTPNFSMDQKITDVKIELEDLQHAINPITGVSIDSKVMIEDLTINSKSSIRAGVFIENAKEVRISKSTIQSRYADNGVRISRVTGTCEVNTVTTGKGFNTGIQASANREALSIGFKFDHNFIDGVLEEGIGFDSYANEPSLVPVICKSYISKISGNVVELEKLYFIEKLGDQGYRNMLVTADFVGDATNYLLVADNQYQISTIESFEPFHSGQSIRLKLAGNLSPQLGEEVSLVTGFYNCSISHNTIKGSIPKSNQPGHALSLWGGGYYNTFKGNEVHGGRSGLSFSSLGAFGVTDPDYFCHAIGNQIIGNTIHGTQNPFRITSEYSLRKGYGNRFSENSIQGGDFLINNQLEFQMNGNTLADNSGWIEDVKGVFEDNTLIDTVITLKNCPDLLIGKNELKGTSKIVRV